MNEMYLDVGAHVRFRDGSGGAIHKFAVDLSSRQVTDIVVVTGLLPRHTHVIPVKFVAPATAHEVSVALYPSDLANYPVYKEVELSERVQGWDENVVEPNERQLFWYPMVGVVERERNVVPHVHRTLPQGVPAEDMVLGKSSEVHNVDGTIGKVEYLCLGRESWEIRQLVVRKGVMAQYFAIPFAWVNSMTPHRIYVEGGKEQLEHVAIERVPVEELAPAPQPVSNPTLAVGEEITLADQVRDALALAPVTASSIIEVVFEQGVVTLLGEVDNAAIHTTAEQIAHSQPGVLSVVNALEVRPEDSTVDMAASIVTNLLRNTTVE